MDDQASEPTAGERRGAEMIIFLQSVVDIEEPFEKALAGWRSMSEKDRWLTKEWYDTIRERRRADGRA